MSAAPITAIVAESSIRLQPVFVPLPKARIGFGFAFVCLLADIAGWLVDGDAQNGFFAIGLLVSFTGWIYWLFCLWRIHQILARTTEHKYPIGPSRAVGLQLIPFYWAWRFRWPNQLADFINKHSPGSMRKDWPGLCILLASVLGSVALLFSCTSFRLFLIFAVVNHLNRKIRKVVTFTDALHVARKKQVDLAISAGLGASFGFLACRALVEFSQKPLADQLRDATGIVLLSLALARFIEPLADRLRQALGIEASHHLSAERRSRLLRLAVFLVLVLTNFFHDLLHAQIDQYFRETAQILLAGLLVSGGITYFWIAGARQRPGRAACFGCLSGAFMALFLAFTIAVILEAAPEKKNAQATAPEPSITLISHRLPLPPVPWVRESEWASVRPVSMVWPWMLFGLLGGIVVDRRWRGPERIAVAIMGAALVCAVVMLLQEAHITKAEIVKVFAHLSASSGWCIGVLMHPSARAIFSHMDIQPPDGAQMQQVVMSGA